jgi:hypothetical protein
MAASTGCPTGNCGAPSIYPSPVLAPTTNNFAPTPANSVAPSETVNGTYYEYPTSTTVPNATITTEGGYNTGGQPADLVPSLQGINPQTSVQPVLDRLRSNQPEWNNTAMLRRQAADRVPMPSVVESPRQVAQTPARQDWEYSPIRLASYSSNEEVSSTTSNEASTASMQPLKLQGTLRSSYSRDNVQVTRGGNLNGWVEVK